MVPQDFMTFTILPWD